MKNTKNVLLPLTISGILLSSPFTAVLAHGGSAKENMTKGKVKDIPKSISMENTQSIVWKRKKAEHRYGNRRHIG